MALATYTELGSRAGNIKRFAVDDAQTISKGTLCMMKDSVKCSGATLTGEKFAGIAAEQKVANDGNTSIGLFTEGRFSITNSNGTILTGEYVAMSGANLIRRAQIADVISGGTLGQALQDAAANAQVIVEIGNN